MSNDQILQDVSIIPISFFASVHDSGQIKSFAVADEDKPPKNPLYVTREQEGQDFSDNARFDFNEPVSWDELVAVLQYYAGLTYGSKEAAPLFAPTTFKTHMYFNGDGTPYRGFRCKQNATGSALITVDADNKAQPTLTFDEARDRLRDEGVEAVLYTTASNKTGERFRIVLPLTGMVDVETQQQAVRAVCRMLKTGWKSDAGKNNAYSIFYVPGIYPNADNRFEYLRGTFRSAADWYDLYPATSDLRSSAGRLKPAPVEIKSTTKKFIVPQPAPKTNADWDVERDAGHILGEYRCMGKGSERHPAFYGLGTSIAMSAFNRGYDLSVSELYEILLSEHRHNTPSSPYSDAQMWRIADEGIANGRANVGDDPAYLRPTWVDRQFADMAVEFEAEPWQSFDDYEDLGPDEHTPIFDDDVDAEQASDASEQPEAQSPETEQPIDIFDTFDPTPVLTRDMLPAVIATFAFDEAERLGIEPAGIVLPCIITCAAAIHDAIQIQPRANDTRWTESARLWGAVAGDPGVGKTPAINKAVEPTREIEEVWRAEDDKKYAQWQEAMEVHKAQKTAYRKEGGELPQEPEEPHYRRLMVNETSMEGLAERILAHNERGVMILSQELMAFIGSFDAYKSGGVKKDRQIALELFDGGARNRDLVKGTIFCKNWSACILGGIQTDKLKKVAPTMTDDGFLQRFLIAEVESTGMGQDRKPHNDAINDYRWLVQSLARLDPIYFGNPIILSSEAQDYRRQFEELAYWLKTDTTMSSAFRGHANKLNGIFARVLLTMHLIETPHNRSDLLTVVNGETARKTYELMVKFFLRHSLRLYLRFFGEGATDAKWIAGHILAHGTKKLTARDLKRTKKFTTDREINDAVEVLILYGWLEPIQRRYFVLPTEWHVNPAVHTLFPERAAMERKARKTATDDATKKRKRMHEKSF